MIWIESPKRNFQQLATIQEHPLLLPDVEPLVVGQLEICCSKRNCDALKPRFHISYGSGGRIRNDFGCSLLDARRSYFRRCRR